MPICTVQGLYTENSTSVNHLVTRAWIQFGTSRINYDIKGCFQAKKDCFYLDIVQIGLTPPRPLQMDRWDTFFFLKSH